MFRRFLFQLLWFDHNKTYLNICAQINLIQKTFPFSVSMGQMVELGFEYAHNIKRSFNKTIQSSGGTVSWQII